MSEKVDLLDADMLAAMGVSDAAYDEVLRMLGRRPTVDELGTLMAMWHSQGGGKGLLSWLRGQPKSTELHDYIEDDSEPQSRQIKEPRVRECLEIAQNLYPLADGAGVQYKNTGQAPCRGNAIYMVGDVSALFVNSEYGRIFLHLAPAANPMDTNHLDEEYIDLIMHAMQANDIVSGYASVGQGGLFGALLRAVEEKTLGFDVLCCREVRLDSFLFGEECGRYVAWLDEPHEDVFLQRLSEAGLNCCFLGYVTKGRIVVDGMDFGHVSKYTRTEKQTGNTL